MFNYPMQGYNIIALYEALELERLEPSKGKALLDAIQAENIQKAMFKKWCAKLGEKAHDKATTGVINYDN